MTIAIVTSGSRGDVQPYVALGRGLAAAGLPVRILTSADFETLVREAGLDYAATSEGIEALLQTPEWRALMESGNFLKITQRMNAEMKRRAADFARLLPDLIAGSKLVIAGMGGMGGAFSIADQLGIPLLQAYVLPLTPTRVFPSPLTPKLAIGGPVNALSFRLMRQMLWQSVRVADVETRRTLGMRPSAFFGPFADLQRRKLPVLYGYSRHVLPHPADWPDNTHITGYWFLDPEDSWTPPAGLVDFLQAGPPPVYIGFGSMGSRRPEAAGQIALEALRLSGQRGVIASGWGGLQPSQVPDTVHLIPSIPHSWLFPRMAAVVHHGGAGTTAAGLRAGVPSIIVPFMGDQGFWGRRTVDLGVGAAPIPRKRLTAEALAAAIRRSVADVGLRAAAADLGARIRAEDGIGAAVAMVKAGWRG